MISGALVLTTVGSGFHSSSNYNGINNVAKAEQTTDNELWKNVRDALKDANIIDKTDQETVEVKYKLKNGGERSITGTAKLDELHTSNNSTVNTDHLNTVNITRVNPNGNKLDANEAWKKLTDKLKEKNIVKDSNAVRLIHSKDKKDPKISAKVGEDYNGNKGFMLQSERYNKNNYN